MLFSRLAVTQRTIFSRFSLLRQYAASSENNANNIGSSGFLKYTILGTIFGAGIYGIYTNGAPTDQEIERADSKNGFFSNLSRIFNRLVSPFREPVFSKLLPDPYTGPEAKPYTLVIDLDRFLIVHQWDAVNARWKVAKRPGADLFLYYMAHLYELVLFSSLTQFEAEPIMEKLDPYQFISYRLYRFATKYENGVYKKDITKLNRDLSKVLVFGHDPVFDAYPDNFLKVAPWDGDPADRTLENSLDFLEALAFSNSADIRLVVRSFEGNNVIKAFDKKQEDLYESMRQQRLASNNGFKKWITAILMPDIAKAASNEIDLLPYQERKCVFMSQRQQDFAKDMERIKKEYQKQMEANKEYLAANKMPLFDLVTKGPPPPPAELVSPSTTP